MGVSIFNTGYDLQDQIDAAESAIAIVSIRDTHVAITSGQYVYVREHGTLAEGLYRATANIAANGTLSGSNVTAVSGGGLNALNSNLSNYAKYVTKFSLEAGQSRDITTGLPRAYLLATNGYSGVFEAVFCGVGYGEDATRHFISQIAGHQTPAVTLTPLSTGYGVHITNSHPSQSVDITITNIYG